jgi:hypothetical protein
VGYKATSEILELVREDVRKQLGESRGDELMSRAYPRNEHALESPRGGLEYTRQIVALVNRIPLEDRRSLEPTPRSYQTYMHTWS